MYVLTRTGGPPAFVLGVLVSMDSVLHNLATQSLLKAQYRPQPQSHEYYNGGIMPRRLLIGSFNDTTIAISGAVYNYI